MAEQPRRPKPKKGATPPGAPSRLRVLPGGSLTPAPSFRLLTQISAALSTSLDLDGTLTEVLERLNTLIAFDAATLFLLDAARRELQVKAALGVPVSLAEMKSFQVGEGVVGWVVQHGATALITDSTRDARYKTTGVARRARTVLAAPLRTQDQVFGALVLVRDAREPFTADHQRLVEAIAGQAAVAIDHARLYDTERASRRRAEALLATAQACSDAATLPELLDRAVKQVAFAMRAAAAVLIVPGEKGSVIEAVHEAASAPSPSLEALVDKPLDGFALGRALLVAERPLIPPLSDLRALVPEEAWPAEDVRALAAIPIRWQGRLLAALLVGFGQASQLSGAEVELLEEIGRQIALGAEQLRLQGQVNAQQNEMAIGGERNRIARDLHDGIVQYVYALGLSLEHARDLVRTDPDAVGATLTRSIEQVNHVLSEMRTFIYQLRPIIMQEKEIGQWVLDLCKQFQQATGIPVQAEVGSPGRHTLSPDISIALFRIIQEALANIYKHAGASSARLALAFERDGVRLQVQDDGAGILPALDKEPGIGGGQGLTNIEERVHELAGRMQLTSAPGGGTRLEVRFPY